MGGEGVDWVSHAMFTKVPHVFQNLGDGTYYHSGYLAIRQAVAAKADAHLQDPLQRRGRDDRRPAGRRHHHASTRIARQVEAEGVKQVVVALRRHRQVRRDPRPLPGRHRVPRPRRARRGAAAPARDARRDGADLRADLRRREAPPPQEGRAGRPGAAPLHQRARLRRLRRLLGADQLRRRAAARDRRSAASARSTRSSCNKDYSCAKGFCPSFVGVVGGQLRKKRRRARRAGARRASWRRVDALPRPAPHAWTGPYDLLVTGVGGTGVVTVGALIAMAAHLEGKCGERARLHGLRAEGRLGAELRAPRRRARAA